MVIISVSLEINLEINFLQKARKYLTSL